MKIKETKVDPEPNKLVLIDILAHSHESLGENQN
jgi:hypothetical protein